MNKKLAPPDVYASWLDYAIKTMDTRALYLEYRFDGIEADREKMRQAARGELDAKDARIKELEDMIANFCKGQDWAAREWKVQDHIKPLFDLADKLKEKP